MACCSHIDERDPDSRCWRCQDPCKPRFIHKEPMGKYLISINGVYDEVPYGNVELFTDMLPLINKRGLNNSAFLVYSNGVKVAYGRR